MFEFVSGLKAMKQSGRGCSTLRTVNELLETRTLFSSYTITDVGDLPAVTSTEANAASYAPLVRDSSGNLYGVDPNGGVNGAGIIFKDDPSTRVVTPLVTFTDTGGVNPIQLVIDSQGNIFGITQFAAFFNNQEGSSEGSGILFELPVNDQTSLQTIYSFPTASIGQFPQAMAIDSSDNIYCVTGSGGDNNTGTILKFGPGSSTPTVMGSLTATQKEANTLTFANGNLYGTSIAGGTAGTGELFELPSGSSMVMSLGSFTGTTDGSNEGVPLVTSSGNVFGTISNGEIYEYSATTQMITTYATKPDGEGTFYGNLLQDNRGDLFGIGGSDIIEIATPNATATVLVPLATADGSSPVSGLTTDGSGDFFGQTREGGANGSGTVYEVSPGGNGTGGGGGGGTTTLTPTVTKSTLPATAISSLKIHGNVSVTITNSGTTPDTSTTQLYASTDGAVDSASTPLGKPKKLTVKAGKTSRLPLAVPSLLLSAGTYTILAQTTDTAGNVTTATGPTVTVATAYVALAGTVTGVTPAAIAPRKSFSFTLTLVNTGNVDSTGPATIAIGLSTDGLTATEPLITLKKSPRIKAGGKPLTIKLRVKIPISTAAAIFFPIVTYTQGAATFTAAGAETIVIT